MTKTSFRAFYKGTSIEAPCALTKIDEFFKVVVENGEGQIVKFLRDGHTLEQVKNVLGGQLNMIEEGLCRTQDQSTLWTEGTLGDQMAWMAAAVAGTMLEGQAEAAIALWFMNIAALLKLKVIENDNDNGWFFVYERK
jgi:hypothetical protein